MLYFIIEIFLFYNNIIIYNIQMICWYVELSNNEAYRMEWTFSILIVKCNNINVLKTLQFRTACLILTLLTFFDELVQIGICLEKSLFRSGWGLIKIQNWRQIYLFCTYSFRKLLLLKFFQIDQNAPECYKLQSNN